MLNSDEIKCRLISLADSVRSEALFDIKTNIKLSEGVRLKFDNDKLQKIKLCNSIYKFSINGLF